MPDITDAHQSTTPVSAPETSDESIRAGFGILWNHGGPKVYTEADIEVAIRAGIIPLESALRLKDLVLQGQGAALADEEDFRLLSGFNDIFVAIAGLILMAAAAWLLHRTSWLASLTVSALAWGLAEYFVREKRLALTAILLMAAFSGGVWLGAFHIMHDLGFSEQLGMIPAGLITIGATWLHWRRFRVPVTVAVGAAAGVGFLLSLTFFFDSNPFNKPSLMFPLIFFSGLVVLALAIKWDSGDPFRRTRRSDVAFWLHLLAAPLLVHPVFHLLDVFGLELDLVRVGLILGIYLLMASLSLVLDRRALMVSALGYVIYAFGQLFENLGSRGQGFAVSALLIAASLLLLAAFWRPVRAMALNCLPENIVGHLPPVTVE